METWKSKNNRESRIEEAFKVAREFIMKRRRKTFEEKRVEKKRAGIRRELRRRQREKQEPFIPKLNGTSLKDFSDFSLPCSFTDSKRFKRGKKEARNRYCKKFRMYVTVDRCEKCGFKGEIPKK